MFRQSGKVFVGDGDVTKFPEDNSLTAEHHKQNLISVWTKPDSGKGFSTVENDSNGWKGMCARQR